MSILDQAYQQGQLAAFAKFAAGMSAANIRGAVPNVPMASTAASSAAPSLQQVQPVRPAAPRPAAPAATPGVQGWAQRAWGGLNRVASNPLGQIGLSIGAPMLLSGMMSGNNNQQG
jgi:hypothetical protein